MKKNDNGKSHSVVDVHRSPLLLPALLRFLAPVEDFFFHFHGKCKAGFAGLTFDGATTLGSASCVSIPGSGSVAEVPSCSPAPATPRTGTRRPVLRAEVGAVRSPSSGRLVPGNGRARPGWTPKPLIDGSTSIHCTNCGRSPGFKNVTNGCLLLPKLSRIWDEDTVML